MYIKKHFNEDAKKTMRTMVKDIKEEMKKIISNVNWMDDITGKGAIQKIEKMQEYIGYPEELLNVGLLEELYKVMFLVNLSSHFLAFRILRFSLINTTRMQLRLASGALPM